MTLDGEKFKGGDFKQPKRIKNPKVAKKLHANLGPCVLCGDPAQSLHHVLPRSQGGDDVEACLVAVCGDGVRGCHGLLENQDLQARMDLGAYLRMNRPDTLSYIRGKLGDEEGSEWLTRRLLIHL
jgi:hypothetical protein